MHLKIDFDVFLYTCKTYLRLYAYSCSRYQLKAASSMLFGLNLAKFRIKRLDFF